MSASPNNLQVHNQVDEISLSDLRLLADILAAGFDYKYERAAFEPVGWYRAQFAPCWCSEEQGEQLREWTLTRCSIGAVYDGLGQPQKALDFYSQALQIRQKVGDLSGEASTLANIGVVYQNLGQGKLALGFYTQALPLLQKTGDRLGQATTLNNIGTLDDSLGDKAGALTNELVALSLAHAPGERGDSSGTRGGNVGLSKGPPPSFSAYGAPAIQAELAAPSQARAICDLDLEGAVYSSLMRHFSIQRQPILAIHFGLEAVNSYQQLRRDISSLNQQLQTGYTKSKSGTYRALAELVVGQGRLAEAEHVLDLVKDAELRETVRGSSGNPVAPLPLSPADNAVETNVAPASDRAVQLTAESYEFDALNALASPTAAQTARLKFLSAQIAAGNATMETFFNTTLQSELGANSNANARVSVASDQTSSLANLLPDLGPGVLALYTLVGDQHSYIIVTTANTRTRYEINANAADLGKLILSLRELLENPGSGPGVDLEKLDHLLLDPIAADLSAAAKQSPDGIPTLLWSLDGVLRYIPLSALFDSKLPSGGQYLIERARNVVVTPESLTHLRDQPSANLKAVAFGTSKSYPAFKNLPALSGVAVELDSVVHDPTAPESHGPLNGRLMSNDDFTTTALEASLRQQPAIVHIASHFVFQAGDAGESYLLTGGDTTGGSGYGLPLSRIQSDPQLSLRNVSLITLSACETAVSDTTSNGREIDSLGMVMQKRDAAAVLATLWSVNDTTTSLLMSDFYRRWSTTAGIQKIEALRQTQLAMLHGTLTTRPSKKTANSGDSNSDYPGFTHPFYWAPFILIGNFR